MANWLDRELLEICPYNLSKEKYPKQVRDHDIFLASMVRKELLHKKPYAITTVITDRLVTHRRDSWNLFIFGSFRKRYSVIERMAAIATPSYLEFQIVPIIIPVFAREWEARKDMMLSKIIRESGVLIYSKLE